MGQPSPRPELVSTIFALASGMPPAAIAIMRISGPEAFAAARALAGALPEPRRAAVRALRDPATGLMLDRAIVVAFPGPDSATGEDIVEFHLHGGRAVIAAVSAVLATQPGLQPAVAGEFTKRALMAGRIDLAEAEGLGDLLMAQTEGQRRSALALAEGALSRAVSGWAQALLDISARVEAELDFSDEDDVAPSSGDATSADIAALAAQVDAVLANPPVERLRDGIRIVLAGPPNAGKSTLLNAMVQREAAIVSPIAGTTRDRIEAAIIRDGVAYVLTDTAGLAAGSTDPIELIGIERAIEAVAGADIVLWLGDAAPGDDAARTIWLWPRADQREDEPSAHRLRVSGRTGEGLVALWDRIAAQSRQLLPREDQLALNQRQRALCAQCLEALHAAAAEPDLLLIAEQLRLARDALDQITGATHVEAMLDALFSRFCIGK